MFNIVYQGNEKPILEYLRGVRIYYCPSFAAAGLIPAASRPFINTPTC